MTTFRVFNAVRVKRGASEAVNVEILSTPSMLPIRVVGGGGDGGTSGGEGMIDVLLLAGELYRFVNFFRAGEGSSCRIVEEDAFE